MTITLESVKDGQPVAKQYKVNDVLKHMVTTSGWPEVIIELGEAYALNEYDNENAVYSKTGSYTFPA